jgi:light-regulated signal transduction histidine kinase (bacteriophytochrome)
MSDAPVFSEPVDLTNCDREPIHLLGAVQSFGFLVAASGDTWEVAHVSRNVTQWLGIEPAAMIGRPLEGFFSREALQVVRDNLRTGKFSAPVARVFAVPVLGTGTAFDIAVQTIGDRVVIECEPCLPEQAVNSGATVWSMITRLQQAPDLDTFYDVAAHEMRSLSGFDRVMVYKFDYDGSGEVIAEASREGIESYLGLRYPASDIPKQARVLYERNWLRIIPDVGAAPSPIEPQLDASGRPLDLTMSVLRSVSPIHIEYLRNMGIGASMSVSILRDGKLWGLFACHHYGTHLMRFERRTAAELFGQMFSLLMESRERDKESRYERHARTQHDALVTKMASQAPVADGILAYLGEIRDLLTCDGIGAWLESHATLHGDTPTPDEFAGLVGHLNARAVTEVYATHEIGAEYAAGQGFTDRAAGMLAVPLSRPARDWLVFFRKEAARAVSWAGDPNKPVTFGPLGAALTPRKSFERWNETVRGQSTQWQAADVNIAESLRVSLLEVILRLSAETDAERKRAQDRQEILIAELNHRVRNILALIRAIVTQSKDTALSVDSFIEIVGGRIQALARAHDQITKDNWGPASFGSLVAAEAAAYLGQKSDNLRLSGPEVMLEPQGFATLALVIHELVTNSVKHGALSQARGRIYVETSIDDDRRLCIEWRETGGPPVKPPTRRGFGSTVIERSIPYDLKGEASVEYAPSGLLASFVIPAVFVFVAPETADASKIETAKPSAAGASTPEDAARRPQDVLIVEDNLMIALEVEETVRRIGCAEVRTASSVRQALDEIEKKKPQFALLDVNLGTETSFAIAERLDKLAVPFAFTTGYGEDIAFPPKLLGVTRIRKPYSASALRATLLLPSD